MSLIIPANSASAASGYQVDNSLRFNRGSADHLTRTVSASSTTKATYSVWLKRGFTFGSEQCLYAIDDGTNEVRINFTTADTIQVFHYAGGYTYQVATNRVFRDPSAFYNIIIVVDTTQETDTNRVKIYVNGVQETSLATTNYPDENADSFFFVGATLYLGVEENGSSNPIDGYIAEHIVCQGQALAPTSFGEFDDSGIWKPIDGLADLTFGTNGFYLEFKQSGTSQNSSGLGADTSGEDNHFAVNNLTAVDQSTDTCTNNFATWNSLINSNGAITEGNLKYTTSNSSSNYGYRLSTIGVNKGKWYAEIKYTSSSVQGLVGIRSREATAVVHYLGYYADDYGFYIDGSIFQANTDRGDLGASWGNDDIVGIYLDLDNNKLYFSKNGTLYTATGYDITAAASTTTGNYFFSATEWNSSGNGAFELNAGNPVSALANAAITDDNGYGAFEYSPNITGDSAAKKFYALNTKNLAEFG